MLRAGWLGDAEQVVMEFSLVCRIDMGNAVSDRLPVLIRSVQVYLIIKEIYFIVILLNRTEPCLSLHLTTNVRLKMMLNEWC